MKNSPIFSLLFIFGLMECSSPQAGGQADGEHRFAFYNVENLFDTVDDPQKNDDEFTPSGKNKWTQERYRTKLEHLSRVVELMEYPALLGVAEVENATVLKDFCATAGLKSNGYAFVHRESPDERGIDVALVYRESTFKPLKTETIRIEFPVEVTRDQPNDVTRDVLVVTGLFAHKDTLHVLVVHQPSRTGGQQESEPKRLYVAAQIRRQVDALFATNPAAGIVVMGDFNDEPADASLARVLDARAPGGSYENGALYNCFYPLYREGRGTYRYRGDWNMLDQVLLSGAFFQPEKKRLRYVGAQIFQQDWMLYEDKKHGPTPNRTYGGDRYFGGYSDHLPVGVVVR